ncbi:MAG: NOB1 family endonuclease [Methanomethylovorans sp.]|jgi:UPF0271 protein|nr:NOB1 family endonuclease [Methanomethylovorans sp.]
MPIYIADSAVFMMGKIIDTLSTITVPSVVNELKSSESKLRFDLAREEGLRVESPSKEALERIKEVSGQSRDNDELSSTDIEVLAKAYEFGEEAVILTDDYAVQNVASILGIKVEPVVQKKIKDVLIWQKVCIGCKRKFDSGDICPVCGSSMKKRRKKKL